MLSSLSLEATEEIQKGRRAPSRIFSTRRTWNWTDSTSVETVVRICLRFFLLYVVFVFQGDKFFDACFYPSVVESGRFVDNWLKWKEPSVCCWSKFTVSCECQTVVRMLFLLFSFCKCPYLFTIEHMFHEGRKEEVLEIKGLMKEMLERAISDRKHLRDGFPARNHVLQRQTCRGTVCKW